MNPNLLLIAWRSVWVWTFFSLSRCMHYMNVCILLFSLTYVKVIWGVTRVEQCYINAANWPYTLFLSPSLLPFHDLWTEADTLVLGYLGSLNCNTVVQGVPHHGPQYSTRCGPFALVNNTRIVGTFVSPGYFPVALQSNNTKEKHKFDFFKLINQWFESFRLF